MANPDLANRSNPEILGKENIPDSGALLIPNRLRKAGAALLEEVVSGRSITFLHEESAELAEDLRTHLTGGGHPVVTFNSGCSPKELADLLSGPIGEGHLVIYVPSQAATIPSPYTTVPSTLLSLLIGAGVPVLPGCVDNPADLALTIDSHDSGHTNVAFGKVLAGESLNLANYQQAMLELSERTFSIHPNLEGNLAYALLRGLKQHAKTSKLIDGNDGSELPFEKLLAAACVLAKVIQKRTSKPRVGIVLPPGKGGMLANVAVLLSGKIPVNMNFTAAKESVESAKRQADLDLYLSGTPFIEKVPNFPWPEPGQMLLLDKDLPPLKGKIILTLLLNKFRSAASIARSLGLTDEGGRKEAVLLFTSGSSGEPKGVALTHRNILANVTQFGGRLNLGHMDRILGCLPLFHSFGCTVTLWYPVIEGISVVTYPSPLEVPKLAELIHQHKVTLTVNTPTFLRGYLRRVQPEQLASVKLCVTGAEKLPAKLADVFEKKFSKPVFEGYGLTETTPVTNVNLPNLKPPKSNVPALPSHRQGSVGQMLPGLAVRITEPETDEPLPIHSSGMLWLKGANVFEGYLNDRERSEAVLKDGWFKTGDLARVDEDGFLYIEGRLSRFSKIGGEMVPHEVVEDHVNKALGLESETERKIAIVGVPDEAKGEALVLISSVTGENLQEELTSLRHSLLEKGVPSLWIPKTIIRTDAVPLLASGKLDIKGCEELAKSS